jgi:tetratricopeptide (TPR) repeat protein
LRIETYIQASADYTKAISLKERSANEITPQFAAAYQNRGIVYRRQERYPQAIADFERAIKLKPQFAEAYIDRGTAYGEQQDNANAIADFNRAVKLDPKLAKAYYNRGVFYRSQQQYPQAKADLEKAKKLFQADRDTTWYQQTVELLQELPSRSQLNIK